MDEKKKDEKKRVIVLGLVTGNELNENVAEDNLHLTDKEILNGTQLFLSKNANGFIIHGGTVVNVSHIVEVYIVKR